MAPPRRAVSRPASVKKRFSSRKTPSFRWDSSVIFPEISLGGDASPLSNGNPSRYEMQKLQSHFLHNIIVFRRFVVNGPQRGTDIAFLQCVEKTST